MSFFQTTARISNDLRKGHKVKAGQSFIRSGEGFLTVAARRMTSANVIVKFEEFDSELVIPRDVRLVCAV